MSSALAQRQAKLQRQHRANLRRLAKSNEKKQSQNVKEPKDGKEIASSDRGQFG
jgi:hypothetical protein